MHIKSIAAQPPEIIPPFSAYKPVVQTYLASFGKSAKVPRGQVLYGNKKLEKRVSSHARNDQKDHFIVEKGRKIRCAQCHV